MTGPTALLVLGSSALISWVAVAWSIHIAHRTNAVDRPDGGRKVQVVAIPRLGGVAVALALVVAVTAGFMLVGRSDDVLRGLVVLVPPTIAALIGFMDDHASLSPKLRLVLQAGVGLLAWVLGTRIEVTGWAAVDAAIFIVWTMVIINGINLLDNSDGLAGATTLIAALGATVIAYLLGQELISLLGLALMGVVLGFLGHNWHPARVYMGDSGAYFLGTSLAILIARLRPDDAPVLAGIAIAVLLAMLPIVDTAYVVMTRKRAGIHPFTAGRDHLSHRLQARGFSVPRSVVVLQCLSAVGAVAAVSLTLAL